MRSKHPQPRVRRWKAHEQSHHRSAASRWLSLRNGFNGFLRALPGDRALLSPSSPRSLLLKNLTPASGRQDHTPSPSASSIVRLACRCVHRIPRPTFVTIAKRPSLRGAGRGELVAVICPSAQGKSVAAQMRRIGTTGKSRRVCRVMSSPPFRVPDAAPSARSRASLWRCVAEPGPTEDGPRISSAPRRFRGALRSVRGTRSWSFEVMSALARDVG